MDPARPILVIGAGAVGAACASALSRAGLPVLVIADPRRSTTALSGGHLLLQSKKPGPFLELGRRSLELTAAFVCGQEAELGYSRRGSLLLARDPEEEAALHAHHELLRAQGVDLRWLTGPAVRDLEPALSPTLRAASFCPADAQIHPALLAQAWLNDAAAHGARVRLCRAETMMQTAGRVCGVVAGGQEYLAATVVLAAGPWSGEVARLAGLELPLQPRRGLLLRAHSAAPLSGRPLLGAEYLQAKWGRDPRAVAFSLQQHLNGELVLGGTREFVGWCEDGLEDATAEIVQCGASYVPAIGDLEWTAQPAAFRPWMADGQPRIGESEVPGLYLACGFEGDGVTLAAAVAERIVHSLG